MAWRFLEDARDMTTRQAPSVSAITMGSERYYGGCATHLRNACIAHFGDPRKVRDQELMGFVTAMRHASAHTKQDNVRSHIRNFDLTWNSSLKRGEFLLAVGIQWRAIGADQEYASAMASYLAKHGGNPFLALHAATRTIAGWISKPLDNDFEELLKAPMGDMIIRQEIKSLAAYHQIERMVQGRIDWKVDPEDLTVTFGRMTQPRLWKPRAPKPRFQGRKQDAGQHR
jgi:hypothetical protein